jgi:hypothetical protein
MSGGDARRAVDIQPDIAVAHQFRLPGVDADVLAQRHILWPDAARQRALGVGGGRQGRACRGERNEEPITGGIHLVAIMRRARGRSSESEPRRCSVRVLPSISENRKVTTPVGGMDGMDMRDLLRAALEGGSGG